MHIKNSSQLPNKFHDEIDELIKAISETHETGDIQNDIIALFEDIIKFFAGREGDFQSLKEMSKEDQKEIYQEIMTIINILRNISNKADKKEIMTILSNRLIERFTKNKELVEKKQKVKKEEEKQIKELFAKVAMHQIQLFTNRLYNNISSNKSSPAKLSSLKRNLKHFTKKQNNRIKDANFQEREILAKLKGQNMGRKI